MGDPLLAYLNEEFLESEEARPIRILSEYLEPLGRFKELRVQDTVAFFGSARVRSRNFAGSALDRLERRKSRRSEREHAEALTRARHAVSWSRYYEEARELARLLTEWSLSLDSPNHRFVVCSGGGPGIMEAANRGAHDAGGLSIGLNIRLPFEQGSNRYVSEDLRFEFYYFFMRKFWFAYLAKALVVFPGGFGTLDEFFEVVTLAQTKRLASHRTIIMYGSEYWDRIVNFDPMVEWGAIASTDLSIIKRADDPQTAFEILKADLKHYHLEPPTPQERKAPGIAKTRKRPPASAVETQA
jgi:uncharacterized protein (TIGR00730 family)